MTHIAEYALPLFITCAAFLLLFSKKQLFPLFISGCSEGIKTAVGLLPTFVILVVAVRMFCASGALEALCTVLSPICEMLHIPKDLLPVAIMRPVSGSGATAMITELFSVSGPDSAAGKAASVLMGSSDTILYTLSVYFAHTGTKRTGYALPVSFAVMLFCLVLSCFLAETML